MGETFGEVDGRVEGKNPEVVYAVCWFGHQCYGI